VRRNAWHGIFAGIGYAPRVIHGRGRLHSIQVTSFNPIVHAYNTFEYDGRWDTTHGFVTAVGTERRFGPLHITPEVRFVRWNKPAVNESGSRGFFIASTQNQVHLMLGIGYQFGGK
jgi:hypothetical protein